MSADEVLMQISDPEIQASFTVMELSISSASNEKHFLLHPSIACLISFPLVQSTGIGTWRASCFYEARDESDEGEQGGTASPAAASEISVAATLAAVSSALCDIFPLKKEQNTAPPRLHPRLLSVGNNVWLTAFAKSYVKEKNNNPGVLCG